MLNFNAKLHENCLLMQTIVFIFAIDKINNLNR